MRFDSNIDWIQLARYFSGESSPEESAVIESRIDSDRQYREAFEHAKKVWRATGKPNLGVDKREAWLAVDIEIQNNNSSKDNLRLIRKDRTAVSNNTSKKLTRRSSSWALVVILCAIALGITYFYYDVESVDSSLPEVAVFKTTSGQRATVTLPDGSEALLNAESQIQVLSGATDPVRIIDLEGEAFFSVISDSTRPFFVRAGDAEVRVVGTSFNVSAYPEQNEIQVLVTEGEVQLSKNNAPGEAMTLLENDMGVLAAQGKPTRTRDVSVEKLLAWKDGNLVFDHASFIEVSHTLERWFDLEIHISDADIAKRHLSTSFDDPSPNHVISVIASTLNLEYSIHESTVTFFIPERP